MRRTYLPNVLVAIVLVVGLLVPSAATALSSTTVKLWIGKAYMSIHGTQQPIDDQGTKPIIVAGRTLVPIRAVIEAFGGSIDWESSTRKVTLTLGRDSLDLWIGKSQASLNGIALAIDSANPAVVPIIMNSGTIDKSMRLTGIDSRLDLVARRYDRCVNLGLERFNRYLVESAIASGESRIPRFPPSKS